MISLQAEEVEILCAEMDRYFHEAEQALGAKEVGGWDDVKEFAAHLGKVKTFLQEVLVQEKAKGGDGNSIPRIELLARTCALLEKQALQLRTEQVESWAA